MQIQGEAELDIEMIREREEALKQLEVNIRRIAIIFKLNEQDMLPITPRIVCS